MAKDAHTISSELESRKVAEASREAEWKQPSFLREMFLGNFRLDLIHPYPLPAERAARVRGVLTTRSRSFCATRSTRSRSTPPASTRKTCVDGLRKLGAFGMKIPKKYGGLGFSNVEYQKVMQLFGSVDGNLSALLSAHQSIGVPQPLKLFGTRGAQEEVPAALRRGRDLRLRAHRAERRLRPGARADRRAEKTRRRHAYSSTARSSGAPTAPSPSCWW